MPAKNSISKYRNKKNFLTLKTFKIYQEKNPESDISYDEFKLILHSMLKKISFYITDDETGVKLPYIGYLVVSQSKPKKKLLDIKNSKKYNTEIYYNNFHTFGNVAVLKWYNINIVSIFIKIYKFEACRELKREGIRDSMKSGKVYGNWSKKDFINYNKINKLYKKWE